jgi:ketosteroid isomerase-like protein
MPDTNQELIMNSLEAIADGDITALLTLLDPEIEWIPPVQGTLDDVYRGHEGVERLFGALYEAWASIGHEPTNLVELDDQAIVISRVRLEARASGMVLNEVWAYFVEFRGNKIWRVSMYTDPAEALREHSSALLANAPNWPG